MASKPLITQVVNEIIAEHGITELDMEFSGDWWEPSDEIRRYVRHEVQRLQPQQMTTLVVECPLDARPADVFGELRLNEYVEYSRLLAILAESVVIAKMAEMAQGWDETPAVDGWEEPAVAT